MMQEDGRGPSRNSSPSAKAARALVNRVMDGEYPLALAVFCIIR